MPERFIRPTPRVDNIGMPISADDINQLQQIGLWTQRTAFLHGDEQFRQRVLLTMLNNPLVNRGWVDLFSDASFIDMSATQLLFDSDERALSLPDLSLSALYTSRQLSPQDVRQIRFVLGLTDVYLPEGCTCTWQVTTNGQDWYLLPQSGDPLPLARFGTTLRVRATLTRPTLESRPLIRGIAILFEDYNTGRVVIGTRFNLVPPTNYDGPGPSQDGPGTAGTTELMDGILDGILDDTNPIGIISHWDLADVEPDQHHPKNHRHKHDGIDPVHLDEDTVGILPVSQLPSVVVLESEFLSLLPADLVYLSELTEAIQNLYVQIKQEFPADLAINLPNTKPEDYPCFIDVRMIGDTVLVRDPITNKLITVTSPRDEVHLLRNNQGVLRAVVVYCRGKATVDILVRSTGVLQRVVTAKLTALPGDAALAEASDMATGLGA